MQKHRCQDRDPVVAGSDGRGNRRPPKNECLTAFQFEYKNQKVVMMMQMVTKGKCTGRRDASVNGISPPTLPTSGWHGTVELPATYHPYIRHSSFGSLGEGRQSGTDSSRRQAACFSDSLEFEAAEYSRIERCGMCRGLVLTQSHGVKFLP